MDQQDDLRAGRTARVAGEGLSIRQLCNVFLTTKELQRDAGDLAPVTFADYHRTCALVIKAFGKSRLVTNLAVEDFERLRSALAKQYGVHRLSNTVQRVRTLFKYGYDAGLVETPMRFGPAFKRPAQKRIRLHRKAAGSRVFDAAKLRKVIDAAGVHLKAMILLGINCGFGNHDCGSLPRSALDLRTGWIDHSRPKTGIDRRCPLWRETTVALKASLAARPAPKLPELADRVFITRCGASWSKEMDDNPISKEMRKLLDHLKLYRRGLGFYALRHTFETVAGESRDQVAVNFIMGHVDASMAATYRGGISDKRLHDVVQVVREWLYPKARR